MLTTMLSIILFLIFIFLGGIHLYWLFGGTWGLKKAIPTKNDSLNNIPIPKFATLVVALILILFGLLYLVKSELMVVELPNWLVYGYWFIPVLFILRAIGEFNYVGFFKKIKHTEFAKADSKVFSPLCLFIGVIGILIQLM